MIACAIRLISQEQATENSLAESETLHDGARCSFGCEVRLSPRSEMFFRPEEVDRRSERVDNPTSLLHSLSEPQHDSGGLWSWSIWRNRELQGQ